ncbi:MAG: transposase [Candidatus Caldatribacteriota bacterium]|nr:transposase [Candidatus Caldatribacteriota bacterium]
MFRKTDTAQQISLLSSVSQYLSEGSSKRFENETAWQNIFYKQVVHRIDENLFSILFSSENGAPNAPIRTLIGMMILKEGEGYSDQKLFENCRFNLLTRKALGLINMDDPVPAESTYYLLRKRITEYQKETGIDLFEKTFQKITKGQIIDFEISGQSIRMDSKLIGSNIAFYSRYELIHKSLILFYKHTHEKPFKFLSDQERVELDEYVTEKSSETVYRSTKSQIKERLISLGKLIYKILNNVSESDDTYYQTLKRVSEEQYKILDDNKIEITPNKDITAKSVQSPYDTECDFRKKTGKKTKGYNHNITETCDSTNPVNLITDIQTGPATHPDNKFTKPAIKNSQEILSDKTENVHTDGAYNSEENQTFTKEEDINFYLTGFQGHAGQYDLTIKDGKVQIFDNQTNTQIPVTVTKNNKYRIKTKTGYRYFTDKQIESCRLRKQAEQLPKEIRNKRNNVEATIFQLAYHLRKDKTKYRGFFKNKIWAILRSLWINFVRIASNLIKECQKIEANVRNALHFGVFVDFIFLILNLTRLESYKKLKL